MTWEVKFWYDSQSTKKNSQNSETIRKIEKNKIKND